MLKIRYHPFFKKDYKKVVKRGYDIKLMKDIIIDWLLIYEIDNGELILYLTRTGTHSDLF